MLQKKATASKKSIRRATAIIAVATVLATSLFVGGPVMAASGSQSMQQSQDGVNVLWSWDFSALAETLTGWMDSLLDKYRQIVDPDGESISVEVADTATVEIRTIQ